MRQSGRLDPDQIARFGQEELARSCTLSCPYHWEINASAPQPFGIVPMVASQSCRTQRQHTILTCRGGREPVCMGPCKSAGSCNRAWRNNRGRTDPLVHLHRRVLGGRRVHLRSTKRSKAIEVDVCRTTRKPSDPRAPLRVRDILRDGDRRG